MLASDTRELKHIRDRHKYKYITDAEALAEFIECVDLLEDDTDLKLENEDLKEEIERLKEDSRDLDLENEDLKAEIERLKEEIEELR